LTKWKKREPVEDFFIFDDIKDKICKVRGIDDVNEWLFPTEKSLHSPYLLNNIKKAGQRIVQAINNNEKIVISADVDLDGCTSCAILYNYLKTFTNNLDYIYHQRYKGHGIQNQEVPPDTNLLIIVDSSTNETEECKKLKEQGIDIIILDHHPQEKENPYCILVNNNAFNDEYPNKELSGAGICFKTIQVIDDLMNISYSQQFIDLAGVGIYGDAMSMAEMENRYFVYHALKNIKNNGLKAILKTNNIHIDTINSTTIGFQIVPMINACARMNKIELALKLLTEKDFDICLKIAKKCKIMNQERKNKEDEIINRIKLKIDNSHSIIIVQDDYIGKGFNGLIAAKIANMYKKPTLVVKNKDGICSGSGRSYGDINLKKILEENNLVINAVGHATAFGLDFQADRISEIYETLDQKIQKREDVVEYDFEIYPYEIKEAIEVIEQFNYITGKNYEPIKVLIRDLKFKEIKILGKGDTIKIRSHILDLIKFKTNSNYGNDIFDKFDAIGQLQMNSYYNWKKGGLVHSPQIILDDYKVCS
jgi:single-stranded-DNA-specific exonuclease